MPDYSELRIYQENLSLHIEEQRGSLFHRILRKARRILDSPPFTPEVRNVVFSERIVEYPLLFKHLDLPAGGRILDFGCVESLLSLQLCSLGYKVTGMDFRRYPFSHENFDFIQADIMEWEPPAEYFDAVVSISVIEHIGLSGYGDPKASQGDRIAVGKLMKSLKKGGRLYLTVPAGRNTVEAGWYRVYDTKAIRELVPGIETLRLFHKPGRYGAWAECGSEEIDSLAYEDYGAMAPIQGVAFIVARKG